MHKVIILIMCTTMYFNFSRNCFYSKMQNNASAKEIAAFLLKLFSICFKGPGVCYQVKQTIDVRTQHNNILENGHCMYATYTIYLRFF